MDTVEKLNKIALLEDFLPTKKLTELCVNSIYHVTDLRQVTTKYGLRAVATLDNESQVFLPRRISTAFEKDPKMFEQMAQTVVDERLLLKYLPGKIPQIEFSIKQSSTSDCF
ncbi:uncharacterized protein [Venturia canescens]|uniref:uncharacterized protein n=1 Tax=Venturia canescens TaxID=32260 RepID=UPI001C9CE20D|nr:uncharacterized protein LOC122416254 [Venturia canescens]